MAPRKPAGEPETLDLKPKPIASPGAVERKSEASEPPAQTCTADGAPLAYVRSIGPKLIYHCSVCGRDLLFVSGAS